MNKKKLAQINPFVVTLVSLALSAGIVIAAFWLHPGLSSSEWYWGVLIVFAFHLIFRQVWIRKVLKNQHVRQSFLR